MMGKIRISLFVSIIVALLLNEASWASEPLISDSQAPQYIGKDVLVKGIVANVHVSKKGNIFLNFSRPYPNHTFAGVIFAADSHKFKNPRMYEGQVVIVKGTVQNYKGRPEIILKSPDQISIEK
jgi:DNA/RNA endonuclease YhcR with UshA esterase domain